MSYYYREAFNDGYRLGVKHSKKKWIMKGILFAFTISTIMYILAILILI